VFSWLPPNPDSYVGLTDVKAWFITPENVFTLFQSLMVASFTPLQPTLGIAHGDLAAVRPWTPISWSSQRTDLVLMLLPEAVWKSVTVATEDRKCLHTSALCCPVLWAGVDYHFAAEPLLLQTFPLHSRAEIWRTDLLERGHPMTVARWKSLSCSVRPIYCQCLSMEVHGCVLSIILLSAYFCLLLQCFINQAHTCLPPYTPYLTYEH
jgi:hypothetical protein